MCANERVVLSLCENLTLCLATKTSVSHSNMQRIPRSLYPPEPNKSSIRQRHLAHCTPQKIQDPFHDELCPMNTSQAAILPFPPPYYRRMWLCQTPRNRHSCDNSTAFYLAQLPNHPPDAQRVIPTCSRFSFKRTSNRLLHATKYAKEKGNRKWSSRWRRLLQLHILRRLLLLTLLYDLSMGQVRTNVTTRARLISVKT